MELRRLAKRGMGIAFVAVSMMFGPVAAAQEEPPGGTFWDDDGNTHEGYIEAIAAEDVTRGCNPPENDRYCPYDPVTRGQMAAFLNRALDLEPSDEDHFIDDEDSAFAADINALAAADITRGCDPPNNEHFCPDDFVTRGQMAAFLVRGFGYADPGEGDLFVDDDDSVFEDDINRLGTAGVTVGCNPPENDRYCPELLVQRDQMASFLGRALNLEARSVPSTMKVAPYFFVDEEGHEGRPGPFVAPLHRRVAESPGTAEATIEALLAGPTAGEAASTPEVLTAIPSGTELNSVTISDGLATVDLSSEFAAEEASTAAEMRVAQVVFSLTRFNTIEQVLIDQDGVHVSLRTDNAGVVDRPVNRNDYLDYQAAISVEGPLYGDLVDDPLPVTGSALVFEATFQYALTDGDGEIIASGVAMSESGVEWAPFDFTIDYELETSDQGSLIVWTESARDGSQVDVREYPVLLTP